MTQTQITTTIVTFPIEMVNLIDTKQFHLAEHHCFSLLAYNRVRIEAAGTPETAGSVVVLSRTEGKRLTSFLAELDARQELRATPIFYPSFAARGYTTEDPTFNLDTFGTVKVVEWDFTSDHTWDFCSNRELLITNHQTNVAIRLNQPEVLQLLIWLQQEHSNNVRKDLH